MCNMFACVVPTSFDDRAFFCDLFYLQYSNVRIFVYRDILHILYDILFIYTYIYIFLILRDVSGCLCDPIFLNPEPGRSRATKRTGTQC